MGYEQVPEFRMPYEDRLIEEAWAIARTKRVLKESGARWTPESFNIVTFNLADPSGEQQFPTLDIPDQLDYFYAGQRVDERIEESQYCFRRLQRAQLIYSALPPEEVYINPLVLSLNASWNGMRDPLGVDEYFYLAGIPDEELKKVFHYDPEHTPREVAYAGGYFGFEQNGQQHLADLIGKPIAFVNIRTSGRGGYWDMSSRRIITPEG